MPRNGEDARKRLVQAAIALFSEHGFDQTTAAQIAARAGVTERTFFRHFADKREVLFVGQNILDTALSEAVAGAPADLSPIEVLHRAFAAVAPMLEENRPLSEPRQRIISASPALHEREVAKHAALVKSVADALRRRGLERLRADLAAQAGLAVFGHALNAWFANPAIRLNTHIDRAFIELQELSSPHPEGQRRH